MTWQIALVQARTAAARYSDGSVRSTLASIASAVATAQVACLSLTTSNAPNAARARATLGYLSSSPIAKITACQRALDLCGYDFTAAPISAFLARVPDLIAFQSFSGIIGIGGQTVGSYGVENDRTYIQLVNRSAENTLTALAGAFAGATPSVTELTAAFDPAWVTTAGSDTAALVAAGVGTTGVRLALDQAAGASKSVKPLYVASEQAYPYAVTFGIRAGE